MTTDTTTKPLTDFKVHTKIKLAALWTSAMFCYVYGDHFHLFVPQFIQGLVTGKMNDTPTTPLMLLAFALFMSLPSLMITLSLLLRPTINRRLNLCVGLFFTVFLGFDILDSITNEWMVFYVFFGVVEMLLTSTIAWLAWTWEKQE